MPEPEKSSNGHRAHQQQRPGGRQAGTAKRPYTGELAFSARGFDARLVERITVSFSLSASRPGFCGRHQCELRNRPRRRWQMIHRRQQSDQGIC
jgi:hypothetical protein